jgi:hypothetical protein
VRSAVVVGFSRSRGRYERQGILVEPWALEKAEPECTADAEARARQRSRAASQRAEQDRELAERMTEQIRLLFPGCPANEARAIAVYTAVRDTAAVSWDAKPSKQRFRPCTVRCHDGTLLAHNLNFAVAVQCLRATPFFKRPSRKQRGHGLHRRLAET